MKIYKLKQERFVTEASGNLLNIIGSVEIFCKIPFVKSTKKLECLVLRGASVDREILVSCDTSRPERLVLPQCHGAMRCRGAFRCD